MVLLSAGILASCSMNIKELEGKWRVATIGDKEVVTSEKEPFISFDVTEGSIHGCLGVNLVKGSFTFENGKLSFGNMGMTMMMGAPEDMEVENSMTRILEETAKVEVSGNTLTLMDASGTTLATLARAAE